MTAIILSGGLSCRMQGKDKAFLKIDNEFFIKRQIRQLKKIFDKIIIVSNAPKKYRNFKGVKIISDLVTYRGPLGGIYSGLMASNSHYNFVVACDLPFINLELIKYMISLKEGFDIVVPGLKKGYETLFAIYSKDCAVPAYEILQTKNFKISRLFDKVKIREISEREINKFGDPDILFMNINTKEDLWKAKETGGANICQK